VSEFDGDELAALELDRVIFKRLGEYEVRWEFAVEAGFPE